MITVITVGITLLILILAISYYFCCVRYQILNKSKEKSASKADSTPTTVSGANFTNEIVEWPEVLFD